MTALERDQLVERIAAEVEQLRAMRVRGMCHKPWQQDFSLPQLYVLATLHDTGPSTVSSIAQQLGVTIPSASSLVDRMDHHGLVSRRRDERDRRVVTVRISDRGQTAVEEFIGLQRDHLQVLLSIMTDPDLEDLSRGLSALERGLRRLATQAITPGDRPSISEANNEKDAVDSYEAVAV